MLYLPVSHARAQDHGMNAVTTANLVGITGIARRLVQDGAMDEAEARNAMAKATEAKVPLAQWGLKGARGDICLN